MNFLKNLSSTWKLILSIFVTEAVGISSGLLTKDSIKNWYLALNKPTWNPPNYLFGTVWSILYLLMGISFWLIWKSAAEKAQKKNAMWIFAVQLFLNFWWSIIFFNFHAPLLALVNIVLMWLAILMTIIRFRAIVPTAGYLLIPYILWVSFATLLNYNIWILN